MRRRIRWLLAALLASNIFSGCAVDIHVPNGGAPALSPTPEAAGAVDNQPSDRGGANGAAEPKTAPPQADATTASDTKALIRKIQPTVVSVWAHGDLREGQGSGFLFDADGHVLTNAHVVRGARSLEVQTHDGQRLAAALVGLSDDLDVALLRVDGLRGRQPAPLGSAQGLEVGDEVLAFGSPLGLENTVTMGIVSGLRRNVVIEGQPYSGLIQISAPIAPGNSGGPLVLRSTGQVVGINTAGANVGDIGFSIPLDRVLALARGWLQGVADQGDEVDVPRSTPPSPAQVQVPVADEAVALIRRFYSLVEAGEYAAAHGLLGTEFQRRLPLERFAAGYRSTLSTWVAETRVHQRGPADVVVDTWVDAIEETPDGRWIMQRYHFIYTVAEERGALRIVRGQWVGKEPLASE